MTYQEMIDSIRVNIDDMDKTRYTDDVVKIFIKSALRKIYNKIITHGNNPYITETEVTISDQVTLLAFEPLKILSVQDASEIPIPLMDESKARKSHSRAVFLRRVGSSYYLGWYTSLSTDVVLTVIWIPFVDINLNDLAATNQSIPDQYHDIIVAWATILALGADEDNIQTWMIIYNDLIESMIESFSSHNQEIINADGWYQ